MRSDVAAKLSRLPPDEQNLLMPLVETTPRFYLAAGLLGAIVVWGIFAYYVGVIVSGILLGDVPAMFRYPMPAEGVLTYVRIGAVIAGYVFTNLVANELYLVTRPDRRPVPGDLERV